MRMQMRMRMAMALLGTAIAAFTIAATPAPAAGPVWQVCTSLEGGNFEDKGCTKESSSGKFEWAEEKGTEKVKAALLTLLLMDAKATGGSSGIRCSSNSTFEGDIGPGNKATITKVEISNPTTNCTRIEGGCKAGEVEKAVGVDLPWKGELFETEYKVLTKIESDGSGEPGWEWECHTLLGKVKDSCKSPTGEPESARLTNKTSGTISLVSTEFEDATHGPCTQGGTGSGEVTGTVNIESSAAKGIRIAVPEFRAENLSNKDIEVKIEQENTNLELVLESGEGKVWCPSGVTFEPQKLIGATPTIALKPTFPTTCKAMINALTATKVTAESCPLIEMSALGKLAFAQTCKFKVELPTEPVKQCIVTISKQSVASIVYTNKGVPQNIRAKIAGSPINYTTSECGIGNGTKGEFKASLLLKGFEPPGTEVGIEVK